MSASEKISVLVVEDDAIYRESIQALINASEAFTCNTTAESCEEAIEQMRNGDVPEIILLDIDLPGISGVEGIKHFRTLSPSTKIIILTVFDDDDKIFNALCLGASGYLLKSASSENIARYLHDVMSGGAVMSPHIASKVLTMFTNYAQPQEKDYGLTRREKEILQLLVNGMSKKHIADQLCISQFTVGTHLKNIYAKLQVHSQIDVVAKAIKERLI